jgi:arginyl-tRNA synthetase
MIESLKAHTVSFVKDTYDKEIFTPQITINRTPDDFIGDYTIVTFPIAKIAGAKPEVVAGQLGAYLQIHLSGITSYNVVKGFLNISLHDEHWIHFLQQHYKLKNYGRLSRNNRRVMIEFGGPNTNKPLHLGHLRNILIGYSVSELLDEAGYDVVKVNIYNDRGVHICKSMLAYLKFGKNETPESAGMKGDHLVGHYYVVYENEVRKQIAALIQQGKTEEEAKQQAPLAIEIKEMLRQWEAGDEQVRTLWRKLNTWVYEGFEETFKRIGCTYDKHYYESETYLLGKALVDEGLQQGVFYTKPDGSVWIDLTAEGLDEKLVLRADGTSVYITQDIGTADLRYKEYPCERMIYTVANEQDYHFKVLKLICQRLNKPYASGIHHLSYGMVDLPGGRMKSREGTVVDADDLITEMENTAALHSTRLGKLDFLDDAERKKLFHTLGMGALKFYILRVDPKKKMTFNPEESIDFHGFTGTFIQYTHARICSLMRKANDLSFDYHKTLELTSLHPAEKKLIRILCEYPHVIADAAAQYSPALMANYLYAVAKEFNHFYAELSVLNTTNEQEKTLRLQLCELTATVIKRGLSLLGIQAPDRM